MLTRSNNAVGGAKLPGWVWELGEDEVRGSGGCSMSIASQVYLLQSTPYRLLVSITADGRDGRDPSAKD